MPMLWIERRKKNHTTSARLIQLFFCYIVVAHFSISFSIFFSHQRNFIYLVYWSIFYFVSFFFSLSHSLVSFEILLPGNTVIWHFHCRYISVCRVARCHRSLRCHCYFRFSTLNLFLHFACDVCLFGFILFCLVLFGSRCECQFLKQLLLLLLFFTVFFLVIPIWINWTVIALNAVYTWIK